MNKEKPHILIVDDEERVRHFLRDMLEMSGYRCVSASNTAEARAHMESLNYDMVLCDVNMPGGSGLVLVEEIVSRYPDTAVVMVSAMDDPETAKTALELGAYGYIIKPFKINELMINMTNALRRRDLEIQNRCHRENLEKLVKERTEELRAALNNLRETLEGVIQIISLTVEIRDPYTAGHQNRVTNLACAIATEMGLLEDKIDAIRMAGIIHDLGKIAVPAEILAKPGRINEHEFSIIKSHPQVGYDILKGVEFPWPIAQIVYQHHERMDGSGYPRGLSGEEIMMEARILSVADVVEAMASHRPYRPALGIDTALEEISQNRGALYDPDVVDACLKVFKEKGFKFE